MRRVGNAFAPKRKMKDLNNTLFNISFKTLELSSRAIRERNYPQGAHIIWGGRWKCKVIVMQGEKYISRRGVVNNITVGTSGKD